MAESHFTEADGRQLAVDLIRELEQYQTDDEDGPWPWNIKAMHRPKGTQQDNVVLRHLDTIQQSGSRSLLMGFCAVLTDYLGDAHHGGGLANVAFYEKLSEYDIAGRPGAWPKMEG